MKYLILGLLIGTILVTGGFLYLQKPIPVEEQVIITNITNVSETIVVPAKEVSVVNLTTKSYDDLCQDFCGAELVSVREHKEEQILECTCRKKTRFYWDLKKSEEMSANKAASILRTWVDNSDEV